MVERAKEKKKKKKLRRDREAASGPDGLPICLLLQISIFYTFGKKKKKNKKTSESVFEFAVRPRVNGLVTWRNGRREKASPPPHHPPTPSPYKCENERKDEKRNKKKKNGKNTNKKKEDRKEKKEKYAHTLTHRGQMLVRQSVREREREIVGSVWKPFFGPDARPAKKWGRVAAGERPTTATASV